MTLDRTALLPSLLCEALDLVAVSECPPDDMVARIAEGVRVAARAELVDALHMLWPLTRHIDREEWLKAIYFGLREGPSPAKLTEDAQNWLRQWEAERDAALPELMKKMDVVKQWIRERDSATKVIVNEVRRMTSIIHSEDGVPGGIEAPSPPNDPREESGAAEPLFQYLPPDEYCGGGGPFWYDDSAVDEPVFASRLLQAVAFEARERLGGDMLFWGVLGRIDEPFSSDAPEVLEARIDAGRAYTLEVRVENGLADLLDYLNYFDAYSDVDADTLEATYEEFLRAVRRASPAECEELFSQVQRLEYEADGRPPYPVEAHLPIAERLWEVILSKPGVSHGLLGRGGLFYWTARRGANSPSGALAALGLLCEGQCYEFWKVVPFLPFWAAGQAAAHEGKWEFALLCLKRSLVDMCIFGHGLTPRMLEQVDAFSFDARFIREIHHHIASHERQLLGLALRLALHRLKASNLDAWSQLNVVLSEAARRLGIRESFNEEQRLRALLGEKLCAQIDRDTWGFIVQAETNWSSLEERLVKDGDYRVIGLAYRCAIENEWRLKIGQSLSTFEPRFNPERAMLGDMLRTLEENQRTQFGRQVLRGRLGAQRESRLFDDVFLRRVKKDLGEYLNAGAHVSGLDRSGCGALRARLLEGGMLRDLLASVQKF